MWSGLIRIYVADATPIGRPSDRSLRFIASGIMSMMIKGVPEDEEAANWCGPAVDHGDADAQFNLGGIHRVFWAWLLIRRGHERLGRIRNLAICQWQLFLAKT